MLSSPYRVLGNVLVARALVPAELYLFFISRTDYENISATTIWYKVKCSWQSIASLLYNLVLTLDIIAQNMSKHNSFNNKIVEQL